MTYRLGTVVGAGALAVLAFSQGSQWWDIVGAVLMGNTIADVILLIAVAWFAVGTVRSCRSSRPNNNAECPISHRRDRKNVSRLAVGAIGVTQW